FPRANCRILPFDPAAPRNDKNLRRLGQRHFHQVFTQEPDLQLIGTQDVADHHVVGALITQLRGTLGQGSAMADDDLMSVEQTGQLNGYFLPPFGRAWNAGSLSNVMRHCETDAAKKLNALGYGVHNFDLFVVMLIKEQVQLIEGWARNLPMRFFIEVP